MSKFDFDAVHQPGLRPQAADTISRLSTAGMDESPLQDDVPVLKIAKARPEGGKTRTDSEIRYILPGNRGLITVKPAMSEVSQVLDGTDKKGLLTTSEFVTEQVSDPSFREVSNTLGKPGLVYSYNWNGVLIRQTGLSRWCSTEGHPTSLLPSLTYLRHYPVLGGHPGERQVYDILQWDSYWPHMANNAYRTIANFQSRAFKSTKTLIRSIYSCLQSLDRSNFWKWNSWVHCGKQNPAIIR